MCFLVGIFIGIVMKWCCKVELILCSCFMLVLFMVVMSMKLVGKNMFLGVLFCMFINGIWEW